MSDRRQVWETLSRLLQRVEKSIPVTPPPSSETSNLEQEIRKLGKTQHKANLLTEEQNVQVKQALTLAQSSMEQNVRLGENLRDELAARTLKDTFEAILPALDGLEHAIASGQQYLKTRDLAASSPKMTPQQILLVSPADRAMLAGWLDAEFEGPRGVVRLKDLPLPEGFGAGRIQIKDEKPRDVLAVRAPSSIAYDVSGKDFTAFRAVFRFYRPTGKRRIRPGDRESPRRKTRRIQRPVTHPKPFSPCARPGTQPI